LPGQRPNLTSISEAECRREKTNNNINRGRSENAPDDLICLSVKRRRGCQTHWMMSSILCTEKAEMCDARAHACVDTSLATEWLVMADHWRSLAGDGSSQGTLARLIAQDARREADERPGISMAVLSPGDPQALSE
jgi:hypothetical protein